MAIAVINVAERPYRILLIAEAANPEWASVPLIGWSLSRALAKITNAHMITQVRNREALLRAGLVEGTDFTVIDNENIARLVWKVANRLRGGAGIGWTTMAAFSSLAYYSFEYSIWRQFANRIEAGEFDLVHRITPLTPTHQSFIARRLAKYRIPFVIGPLNGGVPWPKNFSDRQRAEREWMSYIRGLFKLMPGYQSTREHSAAIIVGSKHTRSEIPRWAQKKCVYIPENGVDPVRFKLVRTRCASIPLKGAFVGRLVPYKGADILLEAAAGFLKSGKLQLHIVGDGPQKPLLEIMARQLGICSNVVFHGWIPHTEVQTILRECDFMALPSIREFGGAVVVESMALSVTPIVADYGGPSELIDDTTGIRVKFHDKQSLVDGFTQTIAEIMHSPEILDRLGAAGRMKVQERLTWDAKASQIVAVYDAVLAKVQDFRSLGWDCG